MGNPQAGLVDFEKMDISQPQPTLQTDIPRLREGGVGAQFWSVWVPVELGYKGEALATTLEQIELVKQMIDRYPDTFELALTADDIERIHGQGKIASLIGVEGGHCIEESLSRAREALQPRRPLHDAHAHRLAELGRLGHRRGPQRRPRRRSAKRSSAR